eukprot:CAMPEP_0171329170 /NCGR_PEP_ID=MMETSP0878-20121228/1086_1 /TAXON_ID=67004 /ORGANISM="Thalassiosira weissflogii, Strain CCMP1336" /LENGTH=93 /DNA_ID=CAMNT_0011829101 /DNA_START=287 /DNA_END=565 /DNA_ORIENTATION=+
MSEIFSLESFDQFVEVATFDRVVNFGRKVFVISAMFVIAAPPMFLLTLASITGRRATGRSTPITKAPTVFVHAAIKEVFEGLDDIPAIAIVIT